MRWWQHGESGSNGASVDCSALCVWRSAHTCSSFTRCPARLTEEEEEGEEEEEEERGGAEEEARPWRQGSTRWSKKLAECWRIV